jgi:hypothetical protein
MNIKTTIYYSLLFCSITFFFACNKNDGSVTSNAKNIVGTDTTYHDTTQITVGDLVMKYNQTDPCFPSSEVFTFTASSKSIASNATYNWYFGDGYTATGNTVEHSYDASSPYVVMLEIKNAAGDIIKSATFSVKAWGKQIKPEASFSVKSDFTNNTNYITFNSTSSINKGSVVNYLWNWGDGTTESSSVGLTRHQFPTVITDKTYPVKLTITSDAGCTSSATVNVTVPATYPITGDFNAVAYEACTNEHFLFTPTATNVPTGSVYYWNFSDGRGDTTASLPIAYKYKYMNDYDVIMSIYLNSRLIYRTHKTVNAKGEDPKPQARFYSTWVSSNATQETWGFMSQSTILHGGIDGYYWDFGNGNIDNSYKIYAENTYQKNTTATNYNIRLIVTGNGCADTTYRSISVSAK